MALKRLNQKACMAKCRKSCMQGEAEFAKPKFPAVQSYARRSMLEATTSQQHREADPVRNTLMYPESVESSLR